MIRDAAAVTALSALIRHYPPRQSTHAAIRALHEMKAAEKAVRFLVDKLKHRHWRVRAAAATTLESFPGLRTVPALLIAAEDRNVDARIAAIHSVWVCSLMYPRIEQSVFEMCENAVRHPNPGVRSASFECLSHMRDPRAKTILLLAAKDPHPQVRQLSDWWLQNVRRKKSSR